MTAQEGFDVIVVGSGAGGAPLAARLAEYGFSVLVLEAGPRLAEGTTASEISRVPAFHGVSSEHPELSWAFSVEHFAKPPEPDDSKRNKKDFPGIFYPRATGIGGCTIHNAMITILGPDSDWDEIAEETGDDSWSSARMRACFQRLERCQYRARPSGLSEQGALDDLWQDVLDLVGKRADRTGGGHGFDGWLRTSTLELTLGLQDPALLKMLTAALEVSAHAGSDDPLAIVKSLLRGELQDYLDPNDRRTQGQSPEGVAVIPTAIHGRTEEDAAKRGQRSSPRERLLEVERRSKAGELKGRLEIWSDCLVHRVLIESEGGRLVARGVEFERGRGLYRATPDRAETPPGKIEKVLARREVVLCGGAFNTPQLLMLSGIGESAHLKEHGIDCLADRPGVGRNLQDRYEVTVVSEMNGDFRLLQDARFDEPPPGQAPDPHLVEWREKGTGIYAINGAVLGIFRRSRPELEKPDLFLFGIPLPFHGYEPGYSKVGHIHDQFTWAILKGHTKNRDGRVRLRSADPRDTPEINFHSFQELKRAGAPIPADDEDMCALVEGVRFVRAIADRAALVVETESHPGREVVPVDDEAALRAWIEREAWGHHASCTCRIGRPDDPEAVLDSRFRVLGSPAQPGGAQALPIAGLRVVDASVFPRIPGYFVVSNIYIVSEKAADVIAEDHS